MGITERKEREKQQRREDILNAAERVFFSKGHKNSTMDDVAEEAELSKGTLYLYFKSKEEIYLAIHLRGMEILTGLFRKAVNSSMTGLEKVSAIGRAFYQFYLDYADYFNALSYYEFNEIDYDDEDSIASECALSGHRTLDILIEALQNGIDDGTVRSDIDPFKTAFILWGQTSGVIQLLSLKGEHLHKQHNLDITDIVTLSFGLIKKSLEKTKKN